MVKLPLATLRFVHDELVVGTYFHDVVKDAFGPHQCLTGRWSGYTMSSGQADRQWTCACCSLQSTLHMGLLICSVDPPQRFLHIVIVVTEASCFAEMLSQLFCFPMQN